LPAEKLHSYRGVQDKGTTLAKVVMTFHLNLLGSLTAAFLRQNADHTHTSYATNKSLSELILAWLGSDIPGTTPAKDHVRSSQKR